MRTLGLPALALGLSVMLSVIAAHAETPEELRNRILTETQFNLVSGDELPSPLSEYKGDGDPMTLEMVVFSNKSDRPSRVSDDGEVIFLYEKASDRVQQKLIQKAFEIRIAKAASET